MSVPPSGDPLRVGDSDDVRRVWSCQPATAELPPVKSFAGDWRQSMVIELSDEEEEEEEEEESTDTDFSELEDEEVDHCEVLDVGEVVVEGGMIGLPESKPSAINDARMDVTSQVKPVGNRAMNKGITSSGVGSGVDAVEAVQHAIVKLALDNAEAAQSRRTLQTRAKRPAAPVRAGSVMAAYPPANQAFMRHSFDSERLRDLKPPHTLPNQYLGLTSRAYRAPNLAVYPHTPTNLALESLRSGLELRAAASVSAVEEAVRARSASPSFPLQDGQPLAPRPNLGFVLPPRLQRLQSMHPRATPSLPTPHLEIPTLPSPRLDIPTLQQRRSSYESPRQPASPTVTLYPGTLSIPPYSVLPRQHRTAPLVHERNLLVPNVGAPQVEKATIVSRAPEASKSLNKSQLPNIVVDNKPVPPAPATAPLSRNHGENRRQTRRSAEAVLSSSKDPKVALVAPTPAPVPPTPAPPAPPATLAPEPTPGANTASQAVASSPKPKQKGTRRRWVKHRKSPASEQTKTTTPVPVSVPSTPVVPAPKPSERTSTPNKASAPPPKKPLTPKPKNDSASTPSPAPKDSSNSTPKPKRKHKPLKKYKSTKPGAAPAPTVPS
ncbi:hypothetical protein RSOLAG22IIIB_11512 [Rhizoctonia solani]|uniref:Uncharacterized protein n=1 Tax=Rhizoctonia solani TaxID=456999 RepID=A0A0K6G8K0_9AGAM|nr:hypothetical protein RSOLAG22IIIB_11512 [Rhizoctonia solani]